MKLHRLQFDIRRMARVLRVSSSGYYLWLKRKPSDRENRHRELGVQIRRAFEDSRRSYGPRRLQTELAEQGIRAGRDQISLLFKKMRLRCVQTKKFKATTDSNHSLPVAPNLLDQKFQTSAPGTVWGADITYVATDEGWLYVAGVKDFHTRELVGYAMASRMTMDLVCYALKKALQYRKPEIGCVAHSDQGSQYCSYEYRRLVETHGMQLSMSRRGNCWDNAPTESFWGTLKQELVHQRKFATRAEAESALREYIEIFYNRMRRHSALGNQAPAVFAQKHALQRRSA